MKLYFSGGSEIVETQATDPHVMVSAFSHVRRPKGKPWRPSARVLALLKIRRKERKK
jgi:hypothetical protein